LPGHLEVSAIRARRFGVLPFHQLIRFSTRTIKRFKSFSDAIATQKLLNRFSELFPPGRIDGYDLVQRDSCITGNGGILLKKLVHDHL
jgi:hypothetical protein